MSEIVSGAAVPFALQAQDVTVRFGGLTALSNVTIGVVAGTVSGLIGPNGAGKSTMFGVLSGLLRPTAGHVLLGGRDITESSPQRRAKAGMARTFQQLELFSGLTVREHLRLAYRVRTAPRRLWMDLVDFRPNPRRARVENDVVEELIAMLALDAVADRRTAGLPLGQCRMVEIARALACEPSILLLDEPSSGLDPGETSLLTDVLQRVSADRRLSVLLIEHDVQMVLKMSEHVTVLDFGQVIAEGTPLEVRASDVVREAYLGGPPT